MSKNIYKCQKIITNKWTKRLCKFIFLPRPLEKYNSDRNLFQLLNIRYA